eukprot:scaffold4503_cov167-Amphora_coffeaeformis.AAC.5
METASFELFRMDKQKRDISCIGYDTFHQSLNCRYALPLSSLYNIVTSFGTERLEVFLEAIGKVTCGFS